MMILFLKYDIQEFYSVCIERSQQLLYSSGQYKVYVPYSFNDRCTVFTVQLKPKISVQPLRATISWERNYHVLVKTKTEFFLRIMA